MGKFLSAHCTSCSFVHNGFSFGSGMMNREPLVPAIENSTGKFIPEANPGDPNLTYYDEQKMYAGHIKGNGIQFFDIHINPEHNLCPKCGEFTMEFRVTGYWD